MFRIVRVTLLGAFLVVLTTLQAQSLKPYFSATEYCNLLGLSARQGDTPWVSVKTPIPDGYKLSFRSPEMGMDNRWDLWESLGHPPVISLRGTTLEQKSWVENFYAAMIPAQGTIKLSPTDTFAYKFAATENATVHTGWTIGLATLWPSILSNINDLYTKGERNILIMGHSQGGALAYLLHSQLYYMQQDGKLPKDLVFKTYCSAPPKPGNLYYAYDFDFITRNGMALRVVNALDWVPEMPVSIQTANDVNNLNPLVNSKAQIKKMPLIQRIVVKHVVRQMKGSVEKANKIYKKYMGKYAYKFVVKNLPTLQKPNYAHSMNYATAGIPIILQPTQAYYDLVGKKPSNAFAHHMLYPYFFLVKEHYPAALGY